jgi:hypothetical protein
MVASAAVNYLDIVNDILIGFLINETVPSIRAFGVKPLENGSSIALSQQFPLRFMLQRIPWVATRCW